MNMIELFHTLDYGLLHALVEITRNSQPLTVLAFIGAELLILVFLPVLIGIWAIHSDDSSRRKNRTVTYACLSVIACMAGKLVFAFIYNRPQPSISHPDLYSMGVHSFPQSFPSTYVLIASAITLSVWYGRYTLLAGVLLCSTLIIAIAQVMAGVRYPSDVIGALVIAFLITWIVWRNGKYIKQLI